MGITLEAASTLPTLTQLTQLNLCVESRVEGAFDTAWVYSLTNLKHLALTLRSGSAAVQLHNSLTALATLTSLSISTESMVSLDVTWDALPLLKVVHVACARLHLTERILSLTQMADLASLRIF